MSAPDLVSYPQYVSRCS